MKCLILAGGRGERLWPLSRNNFPKQFIKVQKNHSIFQETVARNMAYCDEFIIVTNYAYRSIIANQMEAFQGVPYRCVFEEEPRRTTAAVALSCLSLQPSEFVFVVSSDQLIDTGECKGLNYQDAILKAKEFARQGRIVLFGTRTDEINRRFGYFTESGDRFVEKPDEQQSRELENAIVFQNLGMMLFQNGTLLNELRILQSEIFKQCQCAKGTNIPEGVLYRTDVLKPIEAVAIEYSVIEKTQKRMGIEVGFEWNDIGSLEDLSKTKLSNAGVGITEDCDDVTVINQSAHQAVVVNHLNNILVVNTADAVYVGRKGESSTLKDILHHHKELTPFKEQGKTVFRPWGYYEQLTEAENYRVRKVVLLPGKTIYEHRHDQRSENWTIAEGTAMITLDGVSGIYSAHDTVSITAGTAHQVSNLGEKPLLLIETAIGTSLYGGDMLSEGVPDITESELGLKQEPIIKLTPAFKDYLWGGMKLREKYGKNCDYDTIAESWEVSAHPAGNCIVANGRHKGLSFGRYLETAGKEVLGWKCLQMQEFPLLVKFIDAKQNLSVQVHPDDDYALENENEYGKNEMWYVVDAEPGAVLYIGFNRDVCREEVERRIADNSILSILNSYPTKQGDVFFIPAGTVHAIGAGNLILEIQQSSNCTYRLYDYDRRDKFGNLRELHIQKALDVLDYRKYEPVGFEVAQETRMKKLRCKYFETTLLSEETRIPLTEDSFHAVVCIEGSGSLSVENVRQAMTAGDSVFIPATNGSLAVHGRMTAMIVRV